MLAPAEYKAHLLTYKSLGKRNFDTFSEASAGRSDWLCDPEVKLDVVRTVLRHDTSLRILIPGIGHSTLARDLRAHGYEHVTVADLDEQQVSADNRLEFAPRYFDLLADPVPSDLVGAFDCVIDSSVTDVFMQLTSGTAPNVARAKRVHAALLSMLRPQTGVMIVFSMNNRPWDQIYGGTRMQRTHLRLRPIFHIVTKRGRSTTKVGEDVLVLVASCGGGALDLDVVRTDPKYASATAWSPALPEDWSSQRD